MEITTQDQLPEINSVEDIFEDVDDEILTREEAFKMIGKAWDNMSPQQRKQVFSGFAFIRRNIDAYSNKTWQAVNEKDPPGAVLIGEAVLNVVFTDCRPPFIRKEN